MAEMIQRKKAKLNKDNVELQGKPQSPSSVLMVDVYTNALVWQLAPIEIKKNPMRHALFFFFFFGK